jgi:ATP-dependent DNA ligase
MTAAAKDRLLATRFLDDWAYQANVRGALGREVLYPAGGNWFYLNELAPRLTAEAGKRLGAFAAKNFAGSERIALSPATADLDEARRWLDSMAGGLDGIIAKNLGASYESGERSGAVLKIKDLRTADCVVGGFRYASQGGLIGSLLLGLYDAGGLLNHVGFTSAIPAGERRELTKKLEKLRRPPGFTGRSPGGPSRWSTERSGEFEPLSPELVAEVQYDHFTGGRFRHGTRLLRWRPDKDPRQCTMAQVERESRSPLGLIRPAAARPYRA